ncbi:hypothetical protein ACFFUB_08775 [Algimonas porphyrae]|uniref:Uncharacterized protein n=1 Tax=Algimonas porphyrae TaxID=1128113 RepID=A0ABQ5V4K7_9PROT|nr:hypothetical protein [Algimonas porphyrae]GLQ21894.1 hypothetical protein GCM10007854_28490 [Algimonas porphyrae]
MTRFAILLLSSVTLSGWGTQAIGQTSYQAGSSLSGSSGSSATYQRGPAFPDLSPEIIAQDVTTEYNRRTGAPEAVGPTFDPFEQDEDLAGQAYLRTTDGVRDLNGIRLQDGVLLEVQLYYTDYGDRDIGRTRDAVFLNGDPVPIVLSDSRELECSSRVTETVYHYDRYYYPGYGGLYRPRPTYFGHSLFDFSYWGGRSDGWHRRYQGPHHTGHPRRYRPERRERRRPTRRWDRTQVPSNNFVPRGTARIVPGQDLPRSRVDHYINGRPAGAKDRTRDVQPDRPRRPRRSDRTDRSRDVLPETLVPGRSDRSSRRDRDRRDRVTVPSPRAPSPRVTTPRIPSPRTSNPRVPSPRVTPQPAKPRPAPPVSKPRPSREPSTSVPERYDMFPSDRPRDGVVVSSVRDCAREDRLTLFIPYDRLEAARFDGLTLFIRDVSYDQRIDQTTVYDERPLYLPPNYIDGFKLGASLP